MCEKIKVGPLAFTPPQVRFGNLGKWPFLPLPLYGPKRLGCGFLCHAERELFLIARVEQHLALFRVQTHPVIR